MPTVKNGRRQPRNNHFRLPPPGRVPYSGAGNVRAPALAAMCVRVSGTACFIFVFYFYLCSGQKNICNEYRQIYTSGGHHARARTRVARLSQEDIQGKPQLGVSARPRYPQDFQPGNQRTVCRRRGRPLDSARQGGPGRRPHRCVLQPRESRHRGAAHGRLRLFRVD